MIHLQSISADSIYFGFGKTALGCILSRAGFLKGTGTWDRRSFLDGHSSWLIPRVHSSRSQPYMAGGAIFHAFSLQTQYASSIMRYSEQGSSLLIC